MVNGFSPSQAVIKAVLIINRLLELSSADYVALADQDDIWLPTKIEDSLYLLQEARFFW